MKTTYYRSLYSLLGILIVSLAALPAHAQIVLAIGDVSPTPFPNPTESWNVDELWIGNFGGGEGSLLIADGGTVSGCKTCQAAEC